MSTNIRNYTSGVPVSQSISRIEFKLAKSGASNITKSYSQPEGELIGMIFNLNNNLYQLPARVDNIAKFMEMQRSKAPTDQQKELIRKQAERTAWKNLSEWVDLLTTFSMIDQLEVEEAFFPYLYSPEKDKTLYQIAKETGYKRLLTAGK